MSDFSVVEQQPLPGGNTNTPASGVYGEKAALSRLEASLPSPAPVGPGGQSGAPIAPLPNTSPARTGGTGEVPGALLAPTTQPDVPQSSPLAMAAPSPLAAAQTWRQRNLVALDALSQSPTVSPETREWAASTRDKLIRASAQ